MRRGGASSRARATLGAFLATLALAAGCGVGARVEAVPAEASRELARARAALARGASEEALAAARRAQELAPDWVAPERLADDVARRALVAGEALERRLDALRAGPLAARELYLVGRLEGAAGRERFERAAALAPRFAWPHHGLALLSFLGGDVRGAVAEGRRALTLARDPWERATFADALAGYLQRAERAGEALEVLRDVPLEELDPGDRRAFAARLAARELASEERGQAEAGLARALALLREPQLDDADAALVARAAFAARASLGDERCGAALEAALAARRGPLARALRAELQDARGAHALAAALREQVDPAADDAPGRAPLAPDPERGPAARAARLALGEPPASVLADWLHALPARVLDADGLPRDARLRALVAAARALPAEGGAPGARVAFGQALLDAGWFLEAQGYAEALAAHDGAAASALDARASAGRALLSGIAAALDAVDAGDEQVAPWERLARSSDAPGGALEGRRVRELPELLAVLQGLFERFHGGAAEDLVRSPAVDYAGLATLVLPGPAFSAADEEAGRGARGARVPGLAAELDAIGRFGVFGQAVGGGGPDGAVLRRLACEPVEGSRLGVRYAGLVAWCEGADVPSRPARAGAPIGGAALHEGYWIDVEVARDEERRWRERLHDLQARRAELAPALATRGPRCASAGVSGPRARARPYAAEGEAERVRLALLVERGASPTLAELLDAVAVHEQGHLCDRTRFLPLLQHAGAVLRMLLAAGFSPAGVARQLEYRAQLTALCETADPRLPLAECLDALDASSGPTEHPAAYRELVLDLLVELDRARERGEPWAAALDAEHFVVHQLHLLAAEDVRQAALALARRVL